MAETSGSGVPQLNALSHREAVLPHSAVGSRWELVSATTICTNSTFDLSILPVPFLFFFVHALVGFHNVLLYVLAFFEVD